MADAKTVYGVGGKLLKAVQSFYSDSSACVRVGNDVSERFNVGLRHDCVMFICFRRKRDTLRSDASKL